jgi:hypothetical protein
MAPCCTSVITEAWITVWQQHIECNTRRGSRTSRNMLASKPTTAAPNLRLAEALDSIKRNGPSHRRAGTHTQRHVRLLRQGNDLCGLRSRSPRSGRRLLDQSPQRQAHRVVEIAIDKAAAAELQPSNDTFKKDAALFRRYAIGGVPDGPKLRIG